MFTPQPIEGTPDDILPQEVQLAIKDCNKSYNAKYAIEIESGELQPANDNDYTVFIRDTGYAIIRREVYAKLGLKKKKLLSKGCSYIRL